MASSLSSRAPGHDGVLVLSLWGSLGGRVIATIAVLGAAIALTVIASPVVLRRVENSHSRYYARKVVRFITFTIALIALAVVWTPFAGRVGVVLGLTAAGIAFAMQEVIGAIAGWFNILSGRIFHIGDRIEMGGVHGDVIDITPLRTKMLEIGSAESREAWVKGRQHTGRIVSLSNKLTFTEPVYNYSTGFEYIWEELSFPISYRSDWKLAEQIMEEEARRASRSEGAREAMESVRRRYPVPQTELEPRVYARATDNWIELSARFVVPVRTARSAKDEMTRRIMGRLDAAGIEVASGTVDVTVRRPGQAADPA